MSHYEAESRKDFHRGERQTLPPAVHILIQRGPVEEVLMCFLPVGTEKDSLSERFIDLFGN